MKNYYPLCLVALILSCKNPQCDNQSINNLALSIDINSKRASNILDSLGANYCANSSTYALIANQYLQMNQFRKSINWGISSIDNISCDQISRFLIISDAYRFLHKPDSAIFYIDLGKRVCPSDSLMNDSYLTFRKGLIYYEHQDLNEALRCFQTSIQFYEGQPSQLISKISLHIWVYTTLFELNEIEKSCEYAKRFLPEEYSRSDCDK